MTTQRTVKKNLIGQEDILYGEGQVTQSRNASNYTINKVRSIYPVNSIAERDALDIDKFTKCRLYNADNSPPQDYEYISGVWVEVSLSLLPFATITNMLAIVNPYDGMYAEVAGFHTDSKKGGGLFCYDAAEDRANHNGVTIIDPTNTADLNIWDNSEKTKWFTAGTGTGCWIRVDYTGYIDVAWAGAINGITNDSQLILDTIYTFCRNQALPMRIAGQYRIDTGLIWNAAGGAEPQTTVVFYNARLTKNFNGIGLTCSGGSSMHIHYGDLVIDKMTNLGDGTGANATAGDYGFVQNSRLERVGNLLIENQAGDSYVCQADTNMNGSRLGGIRIRSCDGKGFTGTGTQDDNAIWTGDIWVNDCYEAGVFMPDTFPARAWDMTMRGENCAQDGVSDQIYTGGMNQSRIFGYTEDNSAGTGVEIHIPAASSAVEFFTTRVNKMTLSSPTSNIIQGNINHTAGTTPTEANIKGGNISNNIAHTITKNWEGSGATNLVKRVVRGNGELSFEVTDRTSGDVMEMDFLPGSGFTFRLQKNGTDEWKTLDGGLVRFLGSILAGGTSAIDGSAILEARSTTKGFLPPRMTTAQRDAISSPSDGLIIYNTTTDKINSRENGVWREQTSV